MTTSILRSFTQLFGLGLIVVGIAGFYTEGALIGLVSTPEHNGIHIFSGLFLIWAERDYARARMALIVLGIAFAILSSMLLKILDVSTGPFLAENAYFYMISGAVMLTVAGMSKVK